MRNVITLRGVYGKLKTYYFTPMKDKNGTFPTFVKRVRYNSNGDSEMILSEKELNSPERDSFIPEDLIIEVTDGTEFDLDIPFERNKWEAIKNSNLIVPERGARDDKGNLIIDGDKRRYGLAELWIERPGEDSERRISKIKMVTKAYTYIEQDSMEGRATKVKLLGKIMRNAPDSDIQDFLYSKAEKDPQLIIDLYTAPGTALKLMLIDALEKQIIIKSKGVYTYGETALGVTEESVLLFLQSPSNKQIYLSIRNETYPDMLASVIETKSVENSTIVTDEEDEPVKSTTKGAKK